MPDELRTERLLLRQWREADKEPFARLNADPEVMEYFVSPLDRSESDAMVDLLRNDIARRGWGLWAVELAANAEFIGFIGLNVVPFEASFTPATEIGWRLDKPYWGHGYATEGARAALAYAFGKLGLGTVVSFTTVHNRRSQAVMRRLGMVEVGHFDHPRIPQGHRIRRHVLFALAPDEFVAGEAPRP